MKPKQTVVDQIMATITAGVVFIMLFSKLWPLAAAFIAAWIVVAYGVPALTSSAKHGADDQDVGPMPATLSAPNQTSRATGDDRDGFLPGLREEPRESGDIAMVVDWPETFLEIERAIEGGDYDFARLWLQKYAYTVVRPDVPQRVRDQFKRLMTTFAKRDPLYQQIIPEIRLRVSQQHGMLQTAIYPLLPHHDQETLRYVLYVAESLGEIHRLKKGRSYQLWPEQPTEHVAQNRAINPSVRKIVWEKPIGTSETESSGQGMSIFIARSENDERISELHKRATACSGTDWEQAIFCLSEASELMRQQGGYSIERFLRLPLFLQQAGRFDEALMEFQLLIDEVPDRSEKTGNRASDSAKRLYAATDYEKIYDKMRLACKRQGVKTLAAEYASLAETYREEWGRLNVIVDQERQEETAELNARMEDRRHERSRI